MSNIPPHMNQPSFKFKGFWNIKKDPYIPPTEEELIAKDLKEVEEERRIRKQTAMGILRNDPELIQEVLLELRKEKIKQIKKDV